MATRRRGNGQGSLFKRQGKGAWIARWFDHTGKRRQRSTLTTDKAVAQRLLTKWAGDAALRREGVVDADLDHFAQEARRSIGDHINDYEAHLTAKRSTSHAGLSVSRVKRIIAVAGIANLQTMTPDAVERALAEIAEHDKLTPQTHNKYLTVANMFANWLVRQKRLQRNPITSVEQHEVGEREHRRGLEPDEAALLIAAAEAGEPMIGRDRKGNVRWELTGSSRAMLYRLACETGLRRGAIDRLVVGDFDTGDEPTVIVRPKANTKNRKLMAIPLRRVTADLLRDYLAGQLPSAKAFDMPAKWETADMLRADLEAARARWIADGPTPEDRAKRAQSDFLAAVDTEGRRLDFHALRTTCGSWLDHAGVATSIAKRVTGHTSERTLRRHYHRATDQQTRRAIESLPAIELQATGTDDERLADNPDQPLTKGNRHQQRHQRERDSVRADATKAQRATKNPTHTNP